MGSIKRLLILTIVNIFFIFGLNASNSYTAWVNEWVELTCPKATIPFGWDGAMIHGYVWSVSSSNSSKVELSRLTTPTIAVKPLVFYEGEIVIKVKHHYYLSRIVGGKEQLKEVTDTHSFYLSCKKVNVSLFPTECTLQIGEQMGLQYSYSTSNSNPSPTIAFESSNPSVASVDFNGNIYAISEGNATITAKTNFNTFASCQVKVKPVDVVSVTFAVPTLTLYPDQIATLNPNILPTNATYKSLTWQSSNEEVVNVNSNGTINALQPGFAEIRATAISGAFGCCYINVLPIDIAYFSIDKQNLNLFVEDQYQFTPTIYPENATNKELHWTSSDTNIIDINQNGLAIAKSEGKAIISATTHNGLSANCVVVVEDKSSGILSVENYADDTYVVYTIEGLCLGHKTLKDLKKGTYIIKPTTSLLSPTRIFVK